MTAIRTSFVWSAGPARIDDGAIVMVIDVAQPATMPTLTDSVEVELSRIRSPSDAVDFVTRFGLLEHGPYLAKSLYTPDHPQTTPDDEIPSEARESYAIFEQSADEIRTILRTMKNIRAAAGGDEAALRALHGWERRTRPEDSKINLSEEAFLPTLTWEIGLMLSLGMQTETRPLPTLSVWGPAFPLEDLRAAPDRLTLQVSIPTLRAFAYWSLAQKLIARDPIESCPECHHDFVVQYHGKQRKQRFCSRNCARRARYREVQLEQQPGGKRNVGR